MPKATSGPTCPTRRSRLNTDWLAPAFAGKTAVSQLSPDDLHAALTELLPWPLRRRLDAEAPTHFEAPTGTRVAIDYEAEAGPTISIRLQELFGLAVHPSIAGGRIPLVIELLSPGHKPVQITRDLPGFWRGSYAAVRTEMRGRYPRHPWPDESARRSADAARQAARDLIQRRHERTASHRPRLGHHLVPRLSDRRGRRRAGARRRRPRHPAGRGRRVRGGASTP